MLGAGLVEMPAVPYRDPATAVMTDPRLPESKRYCGRCGGKVGRANGDGPGRTGRTEGFCSSCGTAFSFSPKLSEGDMVGGQYEVLGCLAHGGLGWIYLARDHNVSDRWVVLKGLLDSGDTDAMGAAMAERQFLAAVEHPNIVKIYNFVRHAGAGYIVMEYVGGRSLKEIVLARRRQGESLPLPLVLAYGLEILHALGYLHSHGLLYCDLKPDNVLQTEEQLKIIDLGGVISADDDDSPVYGTVGYQAPEVAERGPSPSSDLYTVGRTLAVLSFEFTGYTRRYRNRLPDRDQIPLLTEHESFDRLLRRATDADPDRRFRTAEDMAVQLTGVLREVLSVQDGRPRPAPSTLFGSETRAYGTRPTATPTVRPARVAMATALPIPLADPADPAARLLSGLAASGPAQVFAALSNASVRSIEVELRLIRAKIELGRTEAALNHLAGISQDDWRVGWYRGLANLAGGRFDHAREFFDATFSLLPGEPAPKLALAFCAQGRRDLEQAGRYFELVWNTDHSFISAAFGLAAVRGAQQDHARSVEVLESIPDTSIHYVDAQQAAITARLRAVRLTFAELSTAAERMLALGLDGEPGLRLTADVLETALEWLGRWQTRPADRLVGVEFTESGLRLELERTYRSLAQLTPHRAQRIELIDRANATRPRTRI